MQTNIRANYINDIEILRAFAILLVIFGHLKGFLWKLNVPFTKEIYACIGGGKGVDLFFVVSGFVIAKSILPKLQEAASTQGFFRQSITFWIRRFWRLAPSAWLWLVIPVLLCIVFNQSGAFGTLKGNLAGLAAGFLNVFNIYFANIFGAGEYHNALFVHWTLSLEAQFYLILPLIIFFARKRLDIVLFILVILQLFIFNKQILVVLRTDGFFIGVLIAIWQMRKATYKDFEPTFLRHAGARFVFIGLILLGLMVMSGDLHIVPKYLNKSIAAIVSAAAVFAASYNRNYFVRTNWSKTVLLWIGSRSYAIYLIHIPVYKFVWETCFRLYPGFPNRDDWLLPTLLFTISSLMLTFIISELNFRFIEEPFRIKGRNIGKNYLNNRKE